MPITALSLLSLDIVDKLLFLAVVDSILIVLILVIQLRVQISRALWNGSGIVWNPLKLALRNTRERFARKPEDQIFHTATKLLRKFNDANEKLNAFYAEFRSTEMFHPEWHSLNEEQQRAISDYLSRPRRTSRSYHDAMKQMDFDEPFKEGTLRENMQRMGYTVDGEISQDNIVKRFLAEKSRRVDQFHEASQFPDNPLRTDFGVGTEGFKRVRQEIDSRIFDNNPETGKPWTIKDADSAEIPIEEGHPAFKNKDGGLRCPRCGSLNCYTDWPASKHRCKDCHAFGWVQLETFHTTREETMGTSIEMPFPTKEQIGEPVPIIYDKEPMPPQKALTCPFCQSVGVVWNRKESRLQCMTCDKPYPKPEVPPNRIIKEGQEPG